MDDRATALRPEMKLALARKNEARFVPGRRDFFKYRELGVTEATKGRMRAQVTSAERGLSEPTGWHYHTCDMQFVYVLKGWVDLEFEDGTKARVGEGDSVMIPGGMPHQETATSETMELLELSLPSEMGTVPCEAPKR